MITESEHPGPAGENPGDNAGGAVAPEISRIADRITLLVEDGIRQRGYQLLSALGISLGNDFRRIRIQTNLKLREFITRYLGNRYDVRDAPGYGHGVLAVYKAGTEPADVIRSSSSRSSTDAHIRFHHRFWAAFAVPLREGQRLIDLHDYTFHDVSDDELPADGFGIITPDFVPSEEAESRDSLIREQIDRWLGINGWSRERVAAKQPLKAAPAPNVASTKSVLHAIVEALDRRQLQSVTMPLDVVATLLHTPA
jgi:hypothetical protein